MSLVQGRNVILSIFDGVSAYDPVACNSVCSIETVGDFLETTFVNTGAQRPYIPNKLSSALSGSGPIVLARDITAADIYNMMLNRVVILWRFTLTDNDSNNVELSGSGFFTRINLTGDVASAANCDYDIQVSGNVTVTTSAGATSDGEIGVWTYTATGGESTIGDGVLLGSTVIDVERNGIGLEVITSGTPSGSQVKFTTGAGTLEFGFALGVDEFIQVIYLT